MLKWMFSNKKKCTVIKVARNDLYNLCFVLDVLQYQLYMYYFDPSSIFWSHEIISSYFSC